MNKTVKPNLFIIGAMKSGTTSLHEYLNDHPEIFMSEVKEPGYFAECMNYYPKELDWYESLFDSVQDEKIIGESSTNYTKLPICTEVVEKIQAYNPQARFIYLMRNPVDRIISHYWHGVKYGDERDDPLIAIRKKAEYTSFSDYAMQLEPYIETFGEDKVYTLSFENFIKDTEGELRLIFDWLGVDSSITIKNIDAAHNALPSTFKKVKGRGLLHDFRNSALWNAIAPLVPKKLTSAAAKMTVEEASKSTDKEAALREYLVPMYAPRVKMLEQLLNKKFDEWNLS